MPKPSDATVFTTIIIVILVGLCAHLFGHVYPSQRTPESRQQSISGDLHTIEHDGHLLIMWDNGYGSAFIHHPGCDCEDSP